ncbi:peptidylprolyl isomerase [Puniceicoccaceae bacterium K14]|nr:peptidylprolyl isomerase [Puniceicoccaceae bacterium K14]
MKRAFATVIFFISLGISFSLAKSLEPRGDGLYALLETDLGVMVAELNYKKAPRTVANFVGLAEGTIPWYDLESDAVVMRPFYDGLTFHRVVQDFMIQTGSRSGLGQDGPGYWFDDEFGKGLRHDREGILSMANFGPDLNGSQFFITLKEAPYLNRKHAIFGRVIRGKPIASKIGWSKKDKKGKLLKPVHLIRVKIVRVGEDARAFDPLVFDWPEPRQKKVKAIR